jgi:ubiquitin thioesterase protein OTUB1
MKVNPNRYQDFIEEGTVADYCGANIEAFGKEIDHIGLTAFAAYFVIPAGFALDVLYLDRSLGSEVNTHRFESYTSDGDPANVHAPTMSLLYRP